MKVCSYILPVFILFSISSCSIQPSIKDLNKIINSKKSTIVLIKSHGNITGRASDGYQSKEKFEIINKNDKIEIQYFKPDYYSDSIFTFNLNGAEVDSLFMIVKQSVQTHNPNKKYQGCCMCSNTDFYVSNGNISMEVKNSNKIESMLYGLTKKYHTILINQKK